MFSPFVILSKRCEGRVFTEQTVRGARFFFFTKVTRTQGPDLESEHTATLGCNGRAVGLTAKWAHSVIAV